VDVGVDVDVDVDVDADGVVQCPQRVLETARVRERNLPAVCSFLAKLTGE